MEVDNIEFSLEEEFHSKIEIQQKLTNDYIEKINSKNSCPEDSKQDILNSILETFKDLTSNDHFLFYFRNNQIINAAVLKTLGLLITSDSKFKVQTDACGIIVYLYKFIINNKCISSYELVVNKPNNKWTNEHNKAFFKQILPVVLEIVTINDPTFNQIYFPLAAMTVESLIVRDLGLFLIKDSRFEQFKKLVNYFMQHAEKHPEIYHKLLNSLLQKIDGLNRDMNDLYHFKYRSTLEFYESLKDGLLSLYKIQKKNVTVMKNLNNTLSQLIISSMYYINVSQICSAITITSHSNLIVLFDELENKVERILYELLMFWAKLLKDEFKSPPEGLDFFYDTLTKFKVILKNKKDLPYNFATPHGLKCTYLYIPGASIKNTSNF